MGCAEFTPGLNVSSSRTNARAYFPVMRNLDLCHTPTIMKSFFTFFFGCDTCHVSGNNIERMDTYVSRRKEEIALRSLVIKGSFQFIKACLLIVALSSPILSSFFSPIVLIESFVCHRYRSPSRLAQLTQDCRSVFQQHDCLCSVGCHRWPCRCSERPRYHNGTSYSEEITISMLTLIAAVLRWQLGRLRLWHTRLVGPGLLHGRRLAGPFRHFWFDLVRFGLWFLLQAHLDRLCSPRSRYRGRVGSKYHRDGHKPLSLQWQSAMVPKCWRNERIWIQLSL